MAQSKIYLASRSPRRSELLQQIDIPHSIVDVEIDETPRDGEDERQFVCRMALEKAQAAAKPLSPLRHPLLAADTDVVIDGEILGKPSSREEARHMLQRLSGREHSVLTAVALLWHGEKVLLNESRVRFRHFTNSDIDGYLLLDNPMDKAGGYAIQGRAAAFISHLDGSYSGVMGLPLSETAELLRWAEIL